MAQLIRPMDQSFADAQDAEADVKLRVAGGADLAGRRPCGSSTCIKISHEHADKSPPN
jgi:hypothetical protein